MKTVIEKDRVAYKPDQNSRVYIFFITVTGILSILAGLVLMKLNHPSFEAALWNSYYPLLIVFGTPLTCYGVYRIYANEVVLVFDVQKQYIFKKYPFLPAIKVMQFNAADSIQISQEDNSIEYFLVKKGNVFGKNLRISNVFPIDAVDKKKEEFETRILPAIVEILNL